MIHVQQATHLSTKLNVVDSFNSNIILSSPTRQRYMCDGNVFEHKIETESTVGQVLLYET